MPAAFLGASGCVVLWGGAGLSAAVDVAMPGSVPALAWRVEPYTGRLDLLCACISALAITALALCA